MRRKPFSSALVCKKPQVFQHKKEGACLTSALYLDVMYPCIQADKYIEGIFQFGQYFCTVQTSLLSLLPLSHNDANDKQN